VQSRHRPLSELIGAIMQDFDRDGRPKTVDAVTRALVDRAPAYARKKKVRRRCLHVLSWETCAVACGGRRGGGDVRAVAMIVSRLCASTSVCVFVSCGLLGVRTCTRVGICVCV
jgi:hypothetical protein